MKTVCHKEQILFYQEVDKIIAFITNNSKLVSSNQKVFADYYNTLGVHLYYDKYQTKAKAYFYIPHLLGNRNAFGNFISSCL